MTFRSEILDYNLRNDLEIMVPQPKKEIYKSSFLYHGPEIWNKLSHEVRKAESIGQFKNLYKQHYFTVT